VSSTPESPLSFETDIRPLFRETDRESMLESFDLWDRGAVAENADAILERLRDGSMPCDGAWSDDQVDRLAAWVAQGAPA
jgi:hypothetical protein